MRFYLAVIFLCNAIVLSADARTPFGFVRTTPKLTNYGGGGSCTAGSQIFTSGSGNFTVPAGCTSITIEAWGGGAGGSNGVDKSSIPLYGGGSGGHSGSYAIKTRAATPGEVIAYSVGAGGAGGFLRDGGTTTVDVITAGGGTTGAPGTASGGDTNTSGNSGVAGVTGSTCTSRAGGAGAEGIGGAAGGAAGGATQATVNAGSGAAPGAGGGGGGFACAAFPGPYTGSGGAGGSGQVKFTYAP